MRRAMALAVTLTASAAAALLAHDLFIRLDDYFVAPHAPLSAVLLSGTFSTSENAIARSRFADVSLAGPE